MQSDSKPGRDVRLSGSVPHDCEAVLVYTTFPDITAAQTLGRTLVERRLAGCVNILPGMFSVYIWQGTLEQGNECVLLAKTTPETAPECMRAILVEHPYTTPALLTIPVAAGATSYLDWIKAGSAPALDR